MEGLKTIFFCKRYFLTFPKHSASTSDVQRSLAQASTLAPVHNVTWAHKLPHNPDRMETKTPKKETKENPYTGACLNADYGTSLHFFCTNQELAEAG
mmetsp:Transcript_10465/g.13616  ORF Transcript_10465/g.13616 Transcript_10465/m.13616 type:complete len:97 (-) Transcript_10465:357-647(-)